MNKAIKILDHGLIRLIDHMGSDLSIVRNARVSYDAAWRAGENKGSDKALINYLYKNGHNTPFEAVTVQLEIKAPIFVFRQWHRHRTQCLSGDTKLKFARPCDGKPYWKTIKEIHDQWNIEVKPVKRPDKQKRTLREFNRERINNMELYCIENSSDITTTNIIDCWESGVKEVLKITTTCGNSITASKDHKFLTENGWKILGELSVQDRILTVKKVAPNTTKDFEPFTDEEFRCEIWRHTPYTDIHISSLGRVLRKNTIVEPTINAAGRSVISVKINDTWQTAQVSRLVAEEFLSCDRDSPHALHKDDCPQNNRATNLRWGATQDNHNDALKNGRRAFNGVESMEIETIEPCGKEMTYDIEVSHKDHNFIANNFCTHNSYNELSARYRELPEVFYVPELDQITTQSSDNKQMRTGDQNEFAYEIREWINHQNTEAFKTYHKLLSKECPREIARSVLPVGTYSHMFATANLHNWFGFLRERLHPHAQYEIRVYAEVILDLLEDIAPIAAAAFRDSIK